MQDEALSMHGLSAVLRKEAATIRGALPAGLNDMLWGRQAAAPERPVAVQPVPQAPRTPAWAAALTLTLVVLGALGIWAHLHRTPPGIGSANRMAGEAGRLGETGKARQAGIPEQPDNGVETRLLGTLGSLEASGHPAWVTFGRIRFAPGSTRLSADSNGDLDEIAALLKAHPEVDLLVAGYAEHAGNTSEMLRASRSRADAVKAALVARAVPSSRIATQGVEEDGPLADNPSAPGPASGRRISMRVTQP